MAIARALPGFNDLGHSVTPTFLFRNRIYLQLFPHCPKMNKKSMWEVKKISRFLSVRHRILPSCGCKARETMVDKCKLVLSETHQLTKFVSQVHLNHIWRRTFPFKALIAIFWDLQPLWPSSLTKPDLLRFRCSSGHVLSKTKSVIPHFFCISDISNSSSFNGKIFRKKSMLENFRANVLKENQTPK